MAPKATGGRVLWEIGLQAESLEDRKTSSKKENQGSLRKSASD